MKYINQFTDRHGKVRTYFRQPGQPAVALPNNFGHPSFLRTYNAALAGIPDEARQKAVTQQKRLKQQQIRQDQSKGGVYLLLLDGKVTYVGSSANMARRVADHRKNGRPFDQAFFIATRANERTALERILIEAIRPEQNRNGTRGLQKNGARFTNNQTSRVSD